MNFSFKVGELYKKTYEVVNGVLKMQGTKNLKLVDKSFINRKNVRLYEDDDYKFEEFDLYELKFEKEGMKVQFKNVIIIDNEKDKIKDFINVADISDLYKNKTKYFAKYGYGLGIGCREIVVKYEEENIFMFMTDARQIIFRKYENITNIKEGIYSVSFDKINKKTKTIFLSEGFIVCDDKKLNLEKQTHGSYERIFNIINSYIEKCSEENQIIFNEFVKTFKMNKDGNLVIAEDYIKEVCKSIDENGTMVECNNKILSGSKIIISNETLKTIQTYSEDLFHQVELENATLIIFKKDDNYYHIFMTISLV